MINESSFGIFPVGTTPLGVETLSAAVAVHGEYMVMKKCTIKKIFFQVSTAVDADTTAPVVTFRKRPTPGSATNQSTIGTLTIPDGTAAGKVLYKEVEPVALEVGDSICLDHTTQAADSSAAAGAGYYGFIVSDSPEDLSNQSDAVASA